MYKQAYTRANTREYGFQGNTAKEMFDVIHATFLHSPDLIAGLDPNGAPAGWSACRFHCALPGAFQFGLDKKQLRLQLLDLLLTPTHP